MLMQQCIRKSKARTVRSEIMEKAGAKKPCTQSSSPAVSS